MGRLYLARDKGEIDRRRKLIARPQLVEVWQDLYTPDIVWLGADQARRIAYARKREQAPSGLFWMGEQSKRALDSVGEELAFLLAVQEYAVPIYYGLRLADIESLPTEESLRARVLSAHGIAVAWVTYDEFGQRSEHRPTSPSDPTFYLRRPGGRVPHLWHLFRAKGEVLAYMTERFPQDPEAREWAEQLPAEDFDGLLDRFGQRRQ